MRIAAQRDAVERWMKEQPLSGWEVRAMRSYLEEWIGRPERTGPAVERLRKSVRRIRTRRDIDDWLMDALCEGLWPPELRDL